MKSEAKIAKKERARRRKLARAIYMRQCVALGVKPVDNWWGLTEARLREDVEMKYKAAGRFRRFKALRAFGYGIIQAIRVSGDSRTNGTTA